MPLASTAGEIADYALALFLVLTGLGLAYAFYWLAASFQRLASLIRGVERETLPVINKVGGSVDRVNGQLDKMDRVTDSAVDAADSVDTAVRVVSMAVTRPVQKLSGFAAAVSYGAADFKTKRDWRHAVQAGKEAAARRERELLEELHDAGDET